MMAATRVPTVVYRDAAITMADSTTVSITTPDSMRFVYSIHALASMAGMTLVFSHSGQSVQPRPESVRRTMPPLGMMIHRRAIATPASHLTPFADVRALQPRRKRPCGGLVSESVVTCRS